jgi:LCP family protein required for cell wall assembly
MAKVKRVKMRLKEKIILVVVALLGIALLCILGKPLLKQWKPLEGTEGTVDKDEKVYQLKDDVTFTDDGLDLDQAIEGQFTVLALGFDESNENTDVMMLIMFDINAKEINILQIPRDTYVGGSTTGKINAVYTYGDEDLTPINRVVEKVRDITEIPIDRYIAINCKDIEPVVDAIGGIPIDVPETIEYKSDKIIEAGEQVLTGEQAEWFVRYRKGYSEADVGRMKTQRIFLAACMQKLKDMGATELISALPSVLKYIRSDMSLGEMSSLAHLCENISMDDVTVRMIPGEGVSAGQYNGYDIWSVHSQEFADMLNEYFRPYQKEVDVEDLDLIEIRDTTSYYDEVVDNFEDIINGDVPEVPRN